MTVDAEGRKIKNWKQIKLWMDAYRGRAVNLWRRCRMVDLIKSVKREEW